MSIANWLTLIASFIALLSVIVSYNLGKQQIKNAHELALRQMKAAAEETSRRLKAEILLWVDRRVSGGWQTRRAMYAH